MDVFHKVLTKIYEISGGRETREVDFIELLKNEGFFANRESIKDHLSTEGWITDSARPDHVRITHWGMAEAKKTLDGPGQQENGLSRQLNRLKSATRELATRVEEFESQSSPAAFKSVEERLTEVNNLVSEIKRSI
jgi:hypothetical protein